MHQVQKGKIYQIGILKNLKIILKILTYDLSNLIKNPIYIDADEKNPLPRNSALKIKPKIKLQLEQKFRLRIQDFSSPLGTGLFSK